MVIRLGDGLAGPGITRYQVPQELSAGVAPVLMGVHRHEGPGAAPPGTPVDHRDT